MKKEEDVIELREVERSETIPIFGYELIREVLLRDIFGDDTPEILYWAGKSLARKYPLEGMDEIINFFKDAGWGNLVLKNESKKEIEFELSSPLITKRMQRKDKPHFQLEAGFLAQQIEHHKQMISEAFEHPKKRSSTVLFTIKWDKKDIQS